MPACNIRCPIVRVKLREVVSQAPWIWNEQLGSRGEVDETADRDLDRDDEKEQRAATDRALAKPLIYKAEEEKGKGPRQVSDSRPEGARPEGARPERTGAERTGPERTGAERTRPELARYQPTDINGTRGKTESATQSPHDASSQSAEDKGVDPHWSRSAVRTAETEMEARSRIQEEKEVSTDRELPSRGTDVDGLAKEDDLPERFATTRFEDECEPTCPRRISRKNRLRKLEARQRIVDTYLLNKGTHYFDNVCTCSLSCIVRSLREDSFVRSIIASVALFTLGLKLCMEFDAWYLPIRLS